MTTYTLTAEQLHNLMALIYDSVSTNPKWIADREYAAQMLRSLQPNTQEPALYQSRIRPAWKDDADWLAWETCSKESAEAYERTPLLHDWQYQVRSLYTHQAPQTKPLVDAFAKAASEHGLTLVITTDGYKLVKCGPVTAHGVKP